MTTTSRTGDWFCGVCNFTTKETLAQVFPCEFCEISKNTFFYRTHVVAAFVLLRITSADIISKIKEVLVLKGIFSETKYVSVLTYQISNFYYNPNFPNKF